MKKFWIFIASIIAIISVFMYMFFQYKINHNEIRKANIDYENVYNKEINGSGLATIVNKAIDNNIKNDVSKTEKGIFINNNTNSINIEIKFLQADEVYPIEPIYINDITRFVKLYKDSKFRCTKLEHHKKTGYVKYLYFEEIN